MQAEISGVDTWTMKYGQDCRQGGTYARAQQLSGEALYVFHQNQTVYLYFFSPTLELPVQSMSAGVTSADTQLL